MAQVAIFLFEPKVVSKGRVIIRESAYTDRLIIVSETTALTMLVNFVVFAVIGHRIDKVGWEVEGEIQRKIMWWCKNDSPGYSLTGTGLLIEVWYISRKIIRLFIDAPKRK